MDDFESQYRKQHQVDFETYDILDYPECDDDDDSDDDIPEELLEFGREKEIMVRTYPDLFIGYIWFGILNTITDKMVFVKIFKMNSSAAECKKDLFDNVKEIKARNYWFNSYFESEDESEDASDEEYKLMYIIGNIESLRGNFTDFAREDPYWYQQFGEKLSQEVYNS